jgi:hypothetical protein
MQQNIKDNVSANTTAELSIQKLNRWLIGLVIFMIFYSVMMLIFIDKKTEKALTQIQPVIMVDPNNMGINSSAYTNLIHPAILNKLFLCRNYCG